MKWSHKCRGRYVKRVAPTTTNSNETLCLNGSRIINLEKLKEHLQVVSQHAATCQACADNELSGNDAIILTGEKNKNGLCSVLLAVQAAIQTYISPHHQNQRHQWWSILGMQPGCSMGTDGYGRRICPLMESMAVLGVPSLTKKAFITIEKHIGQWWWTLFEDSMKQAGNKERAIAIANGRFHQGVPAITVIVTGSAKTLHVRVFYTSSQKQL